MKIHFTHSDLDGVGSLVVNNYYKIKYDQVYILDYPDIYSKEGYFIFPESFSFNEEDEVLFTDIGIGKELFLYIQDSKCKYMIFDHHEDTQFIENQENVFYNGKKSGSLLYYEYITKNKRKPIYLDNYIELVNTYDTWDQNSPLWERASELNDVFFNMKSYSKKGYDSVQFYLEYQNKKNKDNEYYFTDYELQLIEKTKEKKYKQLQESLKALKIRTDINGIKFGITMAPTKISYVASEILKAKDIEYIYIINTYKSINGNVSLRIKESNDIDSLSFENFNGHKKAAGGNFDPIDVKQFYMLDGRKKLEKSTTNRIEIF